MSKKKIIAIAVLVGLLIFFAYRWQSSEKNSDMLRPELPPPQVQTAEPAVNASASSGFLPTSMEDPQRFELFQQNLQQMSHCLNIKTNPLDSQAELNFTNLNAAIQPDLGDILSEDTVWTLTDIRTKSGEIHRIYVENENEDRNLTYFLYQADGTHEEIPLSEDETRNPSEAVIASLEAEGDLLGNSIAKRIYYRSGRDLYLVERSGKIYSFELSHNGKSFKCTGADFSGTMKCRCD